MLTVLSWRFDFAQHHEFIEWSKDQTGFLSDKSDRYKKIPQTCSECEFFLAGLPGQGQVGLPK